MGEDLRLGPPEGMREALWSAAAPAAALQAQPQLSDSSSGLLGGETRTKGADLKLTGGIVDLEPVPVGILQVDLSHSVCAHGNSLRHLLAVEVGHVQPVQGCHDVFN